MSYDLGSAHGTIKLDYDGGRAADQADQDINKLKRSSKDADNDLKKFAQTLGKVFSVIGKAAAVVGLAGALATTVVQAAALGIQLLGVIPLLAQIASLAGALPAAVLAGVAAVGILAAAFQGVGDAVKAAFEGDLEKFNEALEKLSPQAREFAQGVRSMVEPLKAVQQGIQDAFFSNNLQDFFPRLVGTLGKLQPLLNGVATQFGGMARQVLNVATSGQSVSFLSNLLQFLRDQLIAITPAIEPILNGLRAVGQVGLDFLAPLGPAVGRLGVQFGEWLTRVSEGGELFGWMSTALDTLKSLGSTAALFGDALFGVLNIANATGGGLLGTLNQIATAVNNFVNSAEGQSALTSLFTAILEVASQLAPVLTTLAGAVITALAPALLRLAQNVGPLLMDVVQRLAPALAPLAEALVNVLLAVTPLLPVIAQVAAVLATLLSGALNNVSSALGPLIQMFAGGLLAAWETLMPLAMELATHVLPIAAAAGLQLAEAFAPLIPTFVKLAQTLVASLLPVLPELAALLADELVPALIVLAEALTGGAVQALEQLIPLIPVLVRVMMILLPLFVQWYTFTIRLVAGIITLLAWIARLPQMILQLTASLISLIGQGLSAAWNAIVTFGNLLGSFFSALPGRIASFLAALPGMLLSLFTQAMDRALFAVGFGIGLIIAAVVKLPPALLRAIISLGPSLVNLFKSAWNSVVAATSAAIASILRFASTIVPRTRSALSSLGGTLASLVSSAWNRFTSGVTNGVNKAVQIARQLPGKIKSGLGNLAGLLTGSGRDLIQGLINGMSGLLDKAVNMAKNAAKRIKDGIASALRIGSPSKVMIQFGKWTIEGLIVGMRSLLGALGKTAEVMANTAIAPTATMTVTPNGTVFNKTNNYQPPPPDPSAGGTLGPYVLQVGDKTLVELIVDAVTGVPKVISRVAKEGDRQNSWANPGRA